MADNLELKACPFCGGEARLVRTDLDERHSYGRAAKVCCTVCGSRVADFYHDDPAPGKYAIRDTADPKAIAAWNTRTPTPPALQRTMPTNDHQGHTHER